MKSKTGNKPRLLALNLIADVLDRGLNLGDTEVSTGADPRNRAHAFHLAYGVLRWFSALDWLAGRLLQRPLKKRDRDIHRLVLIGLFQLWQDGTAPHAAINETAECARPLGKAWAVALINAVLRRFQREQENLLDALHHSDACHAHPDWLLAMLREDWPQDWQDIVGANNCQPPLWLRLNERHQAQQVLTALQADGIQLEPHATVASAVLASPPRAVKDLPGFAAGQVSVQDAAAQLAAGLLQVEAGQRVLDACAAPGGKTVHLLEKYPGLKLTALDRDPARLERVQQNLARAGLEQQALLVAADAAEPDQWWDGKPFERILLDAPCTATGVIRRHPEIKWLRSPDQVARAVKLQARLLEALWPLLAPRGILLYATCSVLRSENESQVSRFVANHSDAQIETLPEDWGQSTGLGRQILPGEQEMDGFFYARLRKK